MSLPISEWEPIKFVCRVCGDTARMNPDDHREWGCVTCNGSSHTLFLNFAPKESSMSVKAFMRPQQLRAFETAWHGHSESIAPILEVFPSGEQIGLSLNK